jgi:hypothetical protein
VTTAPSRPRAQKGTMFYNLQCCKDIVFGRFDVLNEFPNYNIFLFWSKIMKYFPEITKERKI